jgi:hypothetical protein
MNTAYMIYQTERCKTAAEQREADLRTGELAASLARLWHSLAAPLRFRRRAQPTDQQGLRAAAPGRPSAWPAAGLPGRPCVRSSAALDD